eukprot:g33276.t1
MSFASRVIQFEFLDSSVMPLKQLAAGHFMLRLLPSQWGGLPTLRSDLVKLAALLHVPLEDKMTVPQIKEKVKPMVDLLKSKPTTSPSKASSSTTPVQSVQDPPSPVRPPNFKAPPAALMKSGSPVREPSFQLAADRRMAALEQMMKQVGTALANLQSSSGGMNAWQTEGLMPQQFNLDGNSDADMVSLEELSPEALRQLQEDAAHSMENVYQERLEAQYGDIDHAFLTPEAKEAVLDP